MGDGRHHVLRISFQGDKFFNMKNSFMFCFECSNMATQAEKCKGKATAPFRFQLRNVTFQVLSFWFLSFVDMGSSKVPTRLNMREVGPPGLVRSSPVNFFQMVVPCVDDLRSLIGRRSGTEAHTAQHIAKHQEGVFRIHMQEKSTRWVISLYMCTQKYGA